MRRFFTPQQAMADTAYFLQHVREKLGCATPGSEENEDKPNCPVITMLFRGPKVATTRTVIVSPN